MQICHQLCRLTLGAGVLFSFIILLSTNPPAAAFGTCKNAEEVAKYMEEITHTECLIQGANAQDCIKDEELLCKDLQLVRRVCPSLTPHEVYILKELRKHGRYCPVPGY